MTTIRTFRCDLCHDSIKPTPHASKDGFGVHFATGGTFAFKRVADAEHHICHQCAKSTHDELRKVMPAEIAVAP